MKNLPIGTKISLLSCALVALTVILGAVSIWNTLRVNTEVRSIVEGPLPGIDTLGLIQGFKKEQKSKILEHIISGTAPEKAKRETAIADLERQIEAETRNYEKTIQTAKDRELFEMVAPTQQRFDRAVAAILALSRSFKTAEAMEIWNGEAKAASADRARVFSELSQYRRVNAKKSGSSAIALGESASFWCFVLLAVSILSGGLLAFFVVRGMNGVLARIVAELSDGAVQMASVSSHVSASSQSLAQGASEQAASLEETSASSAEMAATTLRNSESSQQAAVLMNVVNHSVSSANRTLADMTTSMGEIGASSNKISKIIKVIDEIAFQTNILALNAAVEAARAGEAGMGFAVVADEVRSLAQRSAQAAKDTANLIEESIMRSAAGSKKLEEVAISIHGITDSASKVKSLVDEVEASSKEQAEGIGQISKAVSQMDEVTQRSAATAEETASASEELSAQAQTLLSIVEQLKGLAGARSAGSRER